MANETLVETTLDGGVATITLNSPGNRNALSAPMRTQLLQAFAAATTDPAVRAVRLTHTGPVFCAGMDLKETAVAEPGREGVRELPRILQAVARCPKPVVAVLNGPARAGGIGIMAAADIVLCVPGATFAFSEVRIGLIPAVISIPVLHRMTPAIARELLLTGALFDAETALRSGLVNRVVEAEEIGAVSDALIADLLRGGPTALAGTKELLLAGLDDSDARYAELLELSARQFSTPEAREGAIAFAEKRPPTWV